MLRAVPRDAARHDLAAIGDEVPQVLGVLVVDDEALVDAEAADPPPSSAAPLRLEAFSGLAFLESAPA